MLRKILACPRDAGALAAGDGALECAAGHRYPVVNGIPVFLLEEASDPFGIQAAVLRRAAGAAGDERAPELYLESLGLSSEELDQVACLWRAGERRIDPVVQYLIAATCGNAYKASMGCLKSYPIPDVPLAPGRGNWLLDLGCNWGRWCIAAARKGYRVVGVDPQLGALMAARRVALQLGLEIDFVCADARYLPFAPSVFDVAFSYSVLQHFSADNCRRAVSEIGRVLRPGGKAKVQLANVLGLRSALQIARRAGREPTAFEVRYYAPRHLLRLFEGHIGTARLEADCFFGLGLQAADADYMGPAGRIAMRSSEALKKASRWFSPLAFLADSVYVEASKA
jgi:SAM-dependent methyltransferase/uncharacterized protein YbaR (Trm112 family)